MERTKYIFKSPDTGLYFSMSRKHWVKSTILATKFTGSLIRDLLKLILHLKYGAIEVHTLAPISAKVSIFEEVK